MSLFDPASVNRQIDAFLQTVPLDKRGALIISGDLLSKRVGASLTIRLGHNVSAYARVTKTAGGPIEADAGGKIVFLADNLPSPFTYSELVAVLRDRGQNWVQAHLGAYAILRGGQVEIG